MTAKQKAFDDAVSRMATLEQSLKETREKRDNALYELKVEKYGFSEGDLVILRDLPPDRYHVLARFVEYADYHDSNMCKVFPIKGLVKGETLSVPVTRIGLLEGFEL